MKTFLAVIVTLSMSACGGPYEQPTGPCNGCWDFWVTSGSSQAVCRVGTKDTACGKGGAVCKICPGNTCNDQGECR